MKSYKTQMENAKIGKDTLELMGMVGALHDLIGQYIDRYERLNPELCGGKGIPDSKYEELCEAFHPAISFLEDAVHMRLTDFMGMTDATEI